MSTVPISSAQVKAEALRLGFAACGLAPAGPVEPWRQAQQQAMVREGRHADMHYLAQRLPQRADPRTLLTGARTVVSLAMVYALPEGHEHPGANAAPCRGGACPARQGGRRDESTTAQPAMQQASCIVHQPAVHPYTLARYARGRDYHRVLWNRLGELLRRLGLEGRALCDTAPIDERYWAWRAGLGFLGRNGQLILPSLGSWCFLGELLLTHEADHYDLPRFPAQPIMHHASCIMHQPHPCQDCTRCLRACPMQALTPEGMDARRCLSYLTIESREPLPPEAARALRRCHSIYGCDRCAEVCPHNSLPELPGADAAPCRGGACPARQGGCRDESPTEQPDPAFCPSPELRAMTPQRWHSLTREQYQDLFRGSAVKRAKYEGLLRNIQAQRGDHV